MRSSKFSKLGKFFSYLKQGYCPVPVGRWEWFFLRLVFAIVVWISFQDPRPYTFDGQPVPNGLARFFDLSWLHRPGMDDAVRWVASALLALYVAGRDLWLTLPALTIICSIVNGYANSQGFIFHGYQIVGLTLIGQSVVALHYKIEQWRRHPVDAAMLASRMEYYSRAIILATYTVSAITKLVNSKGLWVWNSRYLCMEIIKSRRLEYYRTLDPAYAGDIPIAQWMIQHPWLTRIAFSSGFFLELFALLGLKDRSWGLALGLALIFFHRLVLWMMTLTFPYNEALLLIFCVNPFYWFWWWQRSQRRA